MDRTQRLSLLAAIMGTFVVGLDSTVVNVALPAIEEDLGGGLAGQQWVSNGYLLALASLILIGGSLGDVFGERRVFSLGVLGFGVASIVCAVAPSIEVLVAGRVAAGHVRRAALAGRAGGHRHRLPARAARRGDRFVDGVVGDRHRRRAAGRRPADRRRSRGAGSSRSTSRSSSITLVARGDGGAAARAPWRPPAGRLARRRAVVPRPRRADARADPPAGVGLGRAGRGLARARRARVPRPLPLARVDDAVPDAPAGAVLAPQLQRRQPADVRDVRGPGGAVLLPRAVPPAGRRLQRRSRQASRRCRPRRHVPALQARGRAGRPLRRRAGSWAAAGCSPPAGCSCSCASTPTPTT